MPSHAANTTPEAQSILPEEAEEENFEQEMQEVSHDKEDIQDESNAIPKEALQLLDARWSEWKEAEKEKRKTIWKTLRRELKALDCHKGVKGNAWRIQADIYQKWLRNKGRVRPNRKAFQLGRRWTARRVLEDQYKKQVIQMVKDQNKGNYLIELYQPTLKEVLNEVPSEEEAEAQQLAEEWNQTGGPGEAQARFTKKNKYNVMKHFAEEMWKKGGVRMVILAGWKDEESGEIFSTVNDFNPKIANGPAFQNDKKVLACFDPYVRKCFEQDNEDSVDGAHGSEDRGSEPNEPAAGRVKAPGRRGVDREEHVRKVIGMNDAIRLPEINPNDRVEMLSLLRGFLTAHYRKACGNPKATVPFTKLSDFGPHHEIFNPEHAPFGWTVPRDPSKVPKQEAWQFLFHVQQLQQGNGETGFRFNKWLDWEGHLQRNVNDPEYNPASVRTRPKPRPRARVKSRKVSSESESDSDSSDSSEEEETGAVGWPEEGQSNPRKAASVPMSDSESSDGSEDSDIDRGRGVIIPDPKGKGKQIQGYEEYQELRYRDPAKVIPKQGLHSKPSGRPLKPALKKTFQSQSDEKQGSGTRSEHVSPDPEYSDEDTSGVDDIPKAFADPQPLEDAADEEDTLPTVLPKPAMGNTRTIIPPPQQAVAQTLITPIRDPSTRSDSQPQHQGQVTPGAERRSQRSRRAPLPRDADVQVAERVGVRKRKFAGDDRLGKKHR